ncbi:hypothetical protein [Gaoshiqia sp. Z1-71]|uniref:hypothetical protein n=1 Tax=Gaoshiqia hydrogeniformans TaxID=3290090 RepID=UPI003BF8AAA1
MKTNRYLQKILRRMNSTLTRMGLRINQQKTSITKVTHIWDTVSQIKWHLDYKLYKWLKSKGRKAHKTLRQRPFDNLVKYKKMLDIEKYASLKFHAKATG